MKPETETKDRRRGRFGQSRADALAQRLAITMLSAFAAGHTAYLGGLEGPMQQGLRARLCLSGWKWLDADQAARATVEAALAKVGAERPSWAEGQPEFLQHPGTLIARTRCVVCHKRLTPTQFKFCSDTCGGAHHMRLSRIKAATEGQAVWMAIHRI